jgi:SAM-dependent methyltransferase
VKQADTDTGAGAETGAEAGAETGTDKFENDLSAIKRHYTETFLPSSPWSSLINTHPYLVYRQRQRRIRDALVACGITTRERMRALDVLDVGCGAGSNLAWLVELGADPARLTGNDLIEDRIAEARRRFSGIRFIAGDFLRADVGGPYDVVMLLAVLTSVTNPELKRRIVERCFELLKPGGIFFFYDRVRRAESPGSAHYKVLTFRELDEYFNGRPARYFRRDLLKGSVADRIVPRFGVAVAELVQATGLFNIDGTFAYVRAPLAANAGPGADNR